LAVGTFATQQDSGWTQGVATGKMTMGWDFGTRKGDLDIANFGNKAQGYKSFGGEMTAPGYVDFAGDIVGRNGTNGIGAARGSFVGPRPGMVPAGVMGDFGITGGNWKANGVFGGAAVDLR